MSLKLRIANLESAVQQLAAEIAALRIQQSARGPKYTPNPGGYGPLDYSTPYND